MKTFFDDSPNIEQRLRDSTLGPKFQVGDWVKIARFTDCLINHSLLEHIGRVTARYRGKWGSAADYDLECATCRSRHGMHEVELDAYEMRVAAPDFGRKMTAADWIRALPAGPSLILLSSTLGQIVSGVLILVLFISTACNIGVGLVWLLRKL